MIIVNFSDSNNQIFAKNVHNNESIELVKRIEAYDFIIFQRFDQTEALEWITLCFDTLTKYKLGATS
jgi:hypothetical protein